MQSGSSALARRAENNATSTDWAEEPFDPAKWKRVPGHPFADYDAAEGIALWSLWEMPSSAIGKPVRRGRPPGKPTAVRSIRLPLETWKRLEAEASAEQTTVNALIAKRVG
jgi:hypothetical protein